MKVVDANVLLYAVNKNSEHHAAARRWLDTALNGDEAIGFAWLVLLAFVRISTHRAILERPLERSTSLDVVEAWLSQPSAVLVEPSTRHLGALRGVLDKAGRGGNLVNDAHIAALAIEHGAEVVTFDRDFARFGVRHMIPN